MEELWGARSLASRGMPPRPSALDPKLLPARDVTGSLTSHNRMSTTAGLHRTITRVVARDIRFPTSRTLDGSDAMNPDPDYSAAYVVLETDASDGLEGHGLTFTMGRGNELCVGSGEGVAAVVGCHALEWSGAR